MSEKKRLPVPVDILLTSAVTIRRRDVAHWCSVHPDLIDCLVSLGLVDVAGTDTADGEELFSRQTIARIGKIIRLRNQLGINYAGIGVVLELLSRIEELEQRIRRLENDPA